MKNIFEIAVMLLLTMLLSGCSQGRTKVKHIGELRQIMHEGRYEARIDLDTLKGKHIYGLGALESLSGELLILDDRAYTSRAYHHGLVTHQDAQAKATQLVYAQVRKWDTLKIADISNFELLMEKTALQLGLTEPFAFLLEGRPKSLSYHVLNFNPATGDASRHREGAFEGEHAGKEVVILGFYAKDAQGIYTHRSSRMHMHFIDDAFLTMGHVDNLDLSEGAYNLLIPKK